MSKLKTGKLLEQKNQNIPQMLDCRIRFHDQWISKKNYKIGQENIEPFFVLRANQCFSVFKRAEISLFELGSVSWLDGSHGRPLSSMQIKSWRRYSNTRLMITSKVSFFSTCTLSLLKINNLQHQSNVLVMHETKTHYQTVKRIISKSYGDDINVTEWVFEIRILRSVYKELFKQNKTRQYSNEIVFSFDVMKLWRMWLTAKSRL